MLLSNLESLNITALLEECLRWSRDIYLCSSIWTGSIWWEMDRIQVLGESVWTFSVFFMSPIAYFKLSRERQVGTPPAFVDANGIELLTCILQGRFMTVYGLWDLMIMKVKQNLKFKLTLACLNVEFAFTAKVFFSTRNFFY